MAQNINLKDRVWTDPKYQYSAECLGDVVTAPEASLMWNKSVSSIGIACVRGKLDSRLALTDGTLLISIRSLIILYGEPQIDPLPDLKKGHV